MSRFFKEHKFKNEIGRKNGLVNLTHRLEAEENKLTTNF